jgi:hypothetical protein
MSSGENEKPLAFESDEEKAELLRILDTIISDGGGLLTIHHILNGARTMSEIRTRFDEWQNRR